MAATTQVEAKLTIRAVNTSRLPPGGIGPLLDLALAANTLPHNNKPIAGETS
jgi:hypothetical protein